MSLATPTSDPQSRVTLQPWDRDRLALQQALGGRYAIERELGRGGMGVVYLAHEQSLNRYVALKVLPLGRDNPERRERFLREARMVAKLSHKHIVPIHAVDEADEFVYFTMAYLRGGTLANRILAEGPLPVGEVARILRQVAVAVQYAHKKGVIHRDLKPQNILLESRRGRALVSDFGIAWDATEPPPLGSGGTLGTYAYISPERVLGLPADVRSDIYSLGVMAYQAATGRLPFRGNVREILQQHIAAPAPPLDVLGEHLDPTLSRVVARCLAKQPAERIQSAKELAARLSMCYELRHDLPVELQAFLGNSRDTPRPTVASALLGAGGLGALANGLAAADWLQAAVAAGVLALAVAPPLLRLWLMTRRVFAAGYTHEDVIHILTAQSARERNEMAGRLGYDPGPAGRWARLVMKACLGLFAIGLLLVATGINLPEAVVRDSLVLGALTALAAGFVLAAQESKRGALERWLRFWQGRLGEWTARLAGVGLRRLPAGKGAPSPAALPSPSDFHASRDELVHRTKSKIARLQTAAGGGAALTNGLATLEAMLERLMSVDPDRADPGGLTVLIDAARAVCEAVDRLVEGRGGV